MTWRIKFNDRSGVPREWDTQVDIAKEHGVTRACVSLWLKRGFDRPPVSRHQVQFAGRTWKSRKAIARHYKVGEGRVKTWLDRGLTGPEEHCGKAFFFAGRQWQGVRMACRQLNVPETTMRSWLERGLTDFPDDWKPNQGD